jgi:hypothetical protein
MEALTRLVADSLARHGLDRPVDPRRLLWSRWFRCDSPHSLLVVPSKPGLFALAEEVIDLGMSSEAPGNDHVETAAPGCPERSSAGGAALQRCNSMPPQNTASATEVKTKRMLAVLQFSEDDDMAFTLDRMFTRINPMRDRLASGRCFLRFVVITDPDQRRSICAALNQWLLTSAEKASGIGADFSSSLELTESVARTSASATATARPAQENKPSPQPIAMHPAPYRDSGAAKNLHCPHPLPSGF